MTGIRRHRKRLDSQLFWLSFFLFVGTVSGTVFFNHMSAEMKNTLEKWFVGIFTPTELSSVDGYSLFVGVLKKRFVWVLMGLLLCRTSLSQIFYYAVSFYLAFKAAVVICVLTMHGGISGIMLFLGLIFPQGIFYALAAYLLWIGIREPVYGNEKIRFLSMSVYMALGIAAEIFVGPGVSAAAFRIFR